MYFLFYCVSRRKVSIGLHGVYRRCGWNHSRGYRDDLIDEVYDMYYSGDIVSECPIHIKFLGEEGVNMGGVQRDMFSAFWKEA